MRKVTMLVIHCTATKQGVDIGADDVRKWHKQRGWSDIGYHYIIRLDGTLEKGRPVSKQGAHARGFNDGSIGISYVGGLDDNMRPKDTRTKAQKETMHRLVNKLKKQYPIDTIVGHRDLPKVKKACPCFDARVEFCNKKPLPKPVDKIKEIAMQLGYW